MGKNTLYYIGIIVAVIIIAGYMVFAQGTHTITGKAALVPNQGEVQNVVLSMKNYNYYPQEVRVKVNQPVSISLDSSVYGCFRSFTVREFGVAKYLKTPSDTVTFTPTKTGRFTFACSMGMGTGTLIVE